MNHKLEMLITIIIGILILFVMFGMIACCPLLPWVASIGGECGSQWCPDFMGCSQPSEDINLSGDIRRTRLSLWELQNCERVPCPCEAEGCALYCVDCKGDPIAGGVNVS